jgi:hypothetical protein
MLLLLLLIDTASAAFSGKISTFQS